MLGFVVVRFLTEGLPVWLECLKRTLYCNTVQDLGF